MSMLWVYNSIDLLYLGRSQIQYPHPCGPPERLPGRQIAKAAPAGAPAAGGRQGKTPLPVALLLAACNAMAAMDAMNLIDLANAKNMFIRFIKVLACFNVMI